MIRIVLWDLDGTLTDFRAAEKTGIRNCFKKFRLGRCTNEKINKYIEINDRYWQMLERKEITKKELLVKRFDEFFALYNLEADSAAFNEAYQEELRENALAAAGAREAVTKLKELGISQYVVTNGIRESQYKKLAKAGFSEDDFEGIFISDDIGYDKPAKEFFKPVFAQIRKDHPGIKKNEIMIIGDSLTSDIQGGINARIRTCWYNPGHLESEVKRNYELDDLNKITDILEENRMEENKEEKAAAEEKVTAVTETKAEPEKIKVEPKKNHLKDIVDANYRAIIVCLLAIALLFVCLFVGTSGRKNSYELSEITETETAASITLPKKWYMSNDGYAYEVDGKFATPVMYIYAQSTSKDEIESAFEQVKEAYETSEETYNGYETLLIKNLYQSSGDDPVYDCAYMVMSDDEVLCLMFMNVEESAETSILSSIR